MDDIIFQNIIEKINKSSNNINSYFENIDYFNTNIYDVYTKLPKYKIILYILVVFIIFSFLRTFNIRLNEIMAFSISILFIYILLIKDYKEFINYTNVKKNQLNFLHKIMFNTRDIEYAKLTNLIVKPKNSDQKSFLYLNPLIVEFFFNLREYSQLNVSAYANSLLHTNNLLGLDYQTQIGLDRQYLNYETALDEFRQALNEFNTFIYSIQLSKKAYNNFDSSIKILHSLLLKHIQDMEAIFKNDNKTKDIDIYSAPDDFYDLKFHTKADDTHINDYFSVYNIY